VIPALQKLPEVPVSLVEDQRSDRLHALADELAALPDQFQPAGSLVPDVLHAFVRHTAGRTVNRSVETGTGKSSILFSHISDVHTIFAIDDPEGALNNVRTSPLLREASVEIIVGPTQRTLPGYAFSAPLQLALIDGPHGYPYPEMEYARIYPHLDVDALLIVDDIHIPSISNLFRFLREDAMFELIDVVETTAFFRRTATATFDPEGDGWWLQNYNVNRYPETPNLEGLQFVGHQIYSVLRGKVPQSVKVRMRPAWHRVKGLRRKRSGG
jgi:Methyltransferase domain